MPVIIASIGTPHQGGEKNVGKYKKNYLDDHPELPCRCLVAPLQVDILVATHAVLTSASTAFRDLGLAVVDEEQRFGVEQRGKLTGEPLVAFLEPPLLSPHFFFSVLSRASLLWTTTWVRVGR